eukprot:10775-Heterococcus_DN1.PRE.3
MARKKASRKQETTLVPYKASDLSGLLERAKTGTFSAAVQAYLHAGGTAMTFVEAPTARGPIQVVLPHYMAIMNPHPHKELAKCVQLLVAVGADIDASATGPISADHTALSSAATRHCCSKALRVMLRNGAAHKRVRMLDGLPKHLIAFTGCAQNCDALLDSAPDLLEAETTCNTTALALAASQGHCSVVEALHKRGGSLHCTDVQSSTPLHLAASKGHITVMRYLIEHGADVNAVNLKGQPPLHVAASNHTAAAEVLLAHGANVNSTDHCGLTALHAAAEGGHIETATVLIAAGADVTIVDSGGSSSVHRAIDNSNADMVKLLFQQGAAAVLQTRVPCTCAMSWQCGSVTAVMLCKHAPTLKLLLAAGADVHATTSTGNTCLHIAAAHSYVAPVLCLLIKAGVDLHAVNAAGKTAAQVAHDCDHKLAEQLLIRAAQG